MHDYSCYHFCLIKRIKIEVAVQNAKQNVAFTVRALYQVVNFCLIYNVHI